MRALSPKACLTIPLCWDPVCVGTPISQSSQPTYPNQYCATPCYMTASRFSSKSIITSSPLLGFPAAAFTTSVITISAQRFLSKSVIISFPLLQFPAAAFITSSVITVSACKNNVKTFSTFLFINLAICHKLAILIIFL
jgi:hypothetical protein